MSRPRPLSSLLTLTARRRRRRRSFCTSTPPPLLEHTLSHPIYTIWGSNTGVGKTLVSAGLAAAALLSPPPSSATAAASKFIYLKPIQTGFPADSDSRFVFRTVSALFRRRRPPISLFASDHVLQASSAAAAAADPIVGRDGGASGSGMRDLGWYVEKKLHGGHESAAVSELICKTMFSWKEAISPHLAAEREGGALGDSTVIEALQRGLGLGLKHKAEDKKADVWVVVETAGGVASPGPSGSLQCDLYRPFRLPVILIGEGRLGGISATITAYESLNLRGYDVAAVVFEDHGLLNEVSLLSYLKDRVPVFVLPCFPQHNAMMEWFDKCHDIFSSLKEIMLSTYLKRIQKLHDMPNKASDIFWWPFTQHKLVPEETVTVIDSRCGENFSVHKAQNCDVITQQFDACASWWTQGPDATLQIELARNMGYAAARFGHVMFPENVHAPALECAELLLEGVGKGWASRAYFSDNGSTAIEIALKMAFRKFCFDHGILLDAWKANETETPIELRVLALTGCYHGDTLGAMEAQAPSCYTGFLQQPWYTGRGLFLEPPTVFLCNNTWNISLPESMQDALEIKDIMFRSRDELFCKSRNDTNLAGQYSSYISQQLLQYSKWRGFSHIGALIIEPVILGAGGMLMVDPLFQRVLVNESRSRKIPVIFDEVFTGFWRLGVESAAELLCCQPDIACYGKLMTGGIIPLAVTLATSSVFNAFIGESKLKALLHGHSYTAHAMGCTAATKSIEWFKNPQTNTNLNVISGRSLRELWDMDLMHQISSHPSVQRVIVLGTLCALELQAKGCESGYASLYASSLLRELRGDGIYMRPLGNVIYLMCGPCTSPQICSRLLLNLYKRLEEFNGSKEST